METITLASASARRSDILNQIRIPHIIAPQDVDESFDHQADARENAVRLAEDKLESCSRNWPESRWILAADTFIVLEGEYIGKPDGRQEAKEMLLRFAGKTQRVITGVAIRSAALDKTLSRYAETDVTFGQFGEDEADWYLDNEEWEGIAGAYRIQGLAAVLVDHISGSYSNVMGLPIHLIYGMLRTLNYQFTAV